MECKCGASVQPEARFCNACGSSLAAELLAGVKRNKACKFCAEQILESARICRYCNRDQFRDEQREKERQEDELIAAIDQFDLSRAVSLLPQAQQAAYQSEVDRQKKSTGIAYLFFVLLGCFGAHKFYCRERDWGFAYLIPTIINLPLLLAFVFGVATASQQAALGIILIGLIAFVTIFALASLSIGMTVDLFCIPMQVSKANDLIRRNILIDIARRVVPNCPDQLGVARALFPRIVIAVGLSTLILLPISLIAGVVINNPNIQKRLFDEYREISNSDDCLTWCQNNGFPGATIKRETASQNVDVMLQSARFVNSILKLHQRVEQAKNDLRSKSLMKSLEVLGRGYYFHGVESVYLSDGSQLIPHSLGKFSLNGKESKHKEILAEAKRVLADVSTILVKDIPHAVIWQETANQDILQEVYLNKCPWHAISTEIVRVLTGKYKLRERCPNPICVNSMVGMRSDAKCCRDARCRKWIQRHQK